MLISHMLLKPVWKGEHCGAARERTLKALQVVNEKTTVGFFFFFFFFFFNKRKKSAPTRAT